MAAPSLPRLARAPAPPRTRSPVLAYLRDTRRPATSLLAAAPLALLYGGGLLLADPSARSGVDPASAPLLAALGPRGFLGLQLGLVAALVGLAAWRLRERTGRHALLLAPLVAESAAYGLVLGQAILALMERHALLALLDGPLVVDPALVTRAVASAGAGLHEEVLFRLLLLPAVAVGAERALAMPRPLALGLAAVASSLAFAAAHHLAGEPFEAWAFTYRTFAGLAFAGLYLARGFGVAAWTHACYDFHVLSGMG